MREHPIPQDVTGYQFHLIGEMTIKQFGEALLGVLLAFIFYKTNLPIFLKYPLALFFGGGGFLVAFIPYEERPLDVWLITFIKTLYKPTKFYWKKENKIPDAFTYIQAKDVEDSEVQVDLSPLRKQKIHEFITSLNKPSAGLDNWEVSQQNRVDQILQDFSHVQIPETINLDIQEKAQIKKPDLKVRVRKLQNRSINKTSTQNLGPHSQVVFEQQKQSKSLNKAEKPPEVAQTPTQKIQKNPIQTSQDTQIQQKQQSSTTNEKTSKKAVSKSDLPFPNKPTQPNKIVGMVLDAENSLVGGAIIEIKTEAGQVLRAVKSNSLGQFFVSTALDNGKYLLETGKNGLLFPIYHLELTGQVLDPLEIRAETH